MGLEKQLRQYAEWQILLAANSATTMNEDPIDIEEMENVSRWSTEINLRKNLWKSHPAQSKNGKIHLLISWNLFFFVRFNENLFLFFFFVV